MTNIWTTERTHPLNTWTTPRLEDFWWWNHRHLSSKCSYCEQNAYNSVFRLTSGQNGREKKGDYYQVWATFLFSRFASLKFILLPASLILHHSYLLKSDSCGMFYLIQTRAEQNKTVNEWPALSPITGFKWVFLNNKRIKVDPLHGGRRKHFNKWPSASFKMTCFCSGCRFWWKGVMWPWGPFRTGGEKQFRGWKGHSWGLRGQSRALQPPHHFIWTWCQSRRLNREEPRARHMTSVHVCVVAFNQHMCCREGLQMLPWQGSVCVCVCVCL